MNRRVVVPIDLGCCPGDAPVRCALCAPAPEMPDPELVDAYVVSARRELAEERSDDQLVVSFLGGPPPAAPLLDALDGATFTARVRPDLFTRTDLARLVDAGASAIEVDALTFDDHALRRCGRMYGGKRIDEILAGVRAAGLEAGIVLAPGLPGTDADTLLADARRADADIARIHPVLVRSGSTLERWFTEGLYRPLSVDDAVEVCRDMLDVLEDRGVRVVRIGMQPHEAEGQVVAGPVHSSLREAVETRRILARLRVALDGTPPGAYIEIRCARPDEARTRGPENRNVAVLRIEFGLADVRVVADDGLARGEFTVVERGRA